MSGAVIIRRCASAEEAAVVCALLNDAGIEAWLENWHHATVDWLSLMAFGGVGVLVPQSMAAEARERIIEAATHAEHHLNAEFPGLTDDRPSRGRLRAFAFVGLYHGWSYYLLALMLAYIMAMSDASLAVPSGMADPVPAAERLTSVYWGDGLLWIASSLVEFLVLLAIFVFLARRFLNQRARQQQPL